MKKIIIGLAMALVVAGGVWYFAIRKPSMAVAVVAAGPVTVLAKTGTVSVNVDGIAAVEPLTQVTLRSPVSSVLRSVVPAGIRIQGGGLVATLDDAQAHNDLGQAEFGLSQAEVDYRRAKLAAERAEKDRGDKKVLLEGKALSPGDYTLAEEAALNAQLALEAADLKVRQATLSLDKARRDLAALRIKAPFDGTVLKTYVAAGDLVAPNSAVALFGDLSRVRLNAEVDEYDIGKVAVGMNVFISGESIGADPLATTVESISPIAEVVNNISIFQVSAVVDNGKGLLRPGMSADFSIRIASDKGLVVPSKCVATVRSRSYVDVLENGEVVKKRVVKGADDGVNTVILEGLQEGAAVIVPGAVPAPTATVAPAATGEKSVLPITIPGSGGTQ
jgi:RND family efflux transporter MFP subunit